MSEQRAPATVVREFRAAQVVDTASSAPFGGFTARVLRYGPPADDYNSIWEKGVGNEGLASRLPTLAWAHHWDKPIGRGTAWRETDDGLYIDFVFDDPDAVPLSKQARAQILSGTLSDVSVGFTRIADTQNEDGTETITKATIDEVSVVLRGAVMGAEVVAGSARSKRDNGTEPVRAQRAEVRMGDKTVDIESVITVAKAQAAGEFTSAEARAALEALATEPRTPAPPLTDDLRRFANRAAPEGGMSFYDLMAAVRDAVVDRIEETTGVEPEYLWIDDAGLDWAVYCIDGDFWQVPYTIDADGTVMLGDAFEVTRETVYTPVPPDTAGTAGAEEGETRELSDVEVESAVARAARYVDVR